MTRKERLELIAKRLSEITGTHCRYVAGDDGKCYAIWQTCGCNLKTLLIGYCNAKELERQYYVFERAWNMAKHQNKKRNGN